MPISPTLHGTPQPQDEAWPRPGTKDYELHNLPSFTQWLMNMGIDLARIPDSQKPELYQQYQDWLDKKRVEINARYGG